MRRSTKIACIVAGVAALATPVAFAAIPDSDDSEFHACVADSGTARLTYLIDAQGGSSCPTGFTEKTWRQGFPSTYVTTEVVSSMPGAGEAVDCASGDRLLSATAFRTGTSDMSQSAVVLSYTVDGSGRPAGVVFKAGGGSPQTLSIVCADL